MSNTNQLLKGARDILVAAGRSLSVRKIWDIGRKDAVFADGLDALDALRVALGGDADGRYVRSLRAGVFEAAPEPEPEPEPAPSRRAPRKPRAASSERVAAAAPVAPVVAPVADARKPEAPSVVEAPKTAPPRLTHAAPERPRDDTPREEHPREERPRAERPRADRPRDERPRDDRPREDQPREDRPRDERPREDRPRAERPRDDRPRAERPREDRPREDRPREDRPRDERPRDDRPRAEAPKPEAPKAETPKSESPRAATRGPDAGRPPRPEASPPPPRPAAEAPADDDEGDDRSGRRRRRRTTDLLGDAPLAPLSIDEAVEAVEASRDPKDSRKRLWDKIKARASALAGPSSTVEREPRPAPRSQAPRAPESTAPSPAPAARAPEAAAPRTPETPAARTPEAAPPAPKPPVVEAPRAPAPEYAAPVGDVRARLKARLAERAGQKPAAPAELPRVEELKDSPYVEQRAPVPAPAPAPVVERRAPTLPEVQPADDLAAAAEAWLAGAGETPALGALAAALPGRPDTAGLRAALLAENARRAHAGLRAPFVFRFDGRVGLSASSLSTRYVELERRILASMAEQREIVRRELLGRVGQLTDVAFEQVVLDLLARLGFGEVRAVHRNRGTLLVFGRHEALGGASTAMVVRRSASEIGAETLEALRGALEDLEATHGLILTAGTFSADARTSAVDTDEAPVTLIDGAGFARLMYEHGLGVVAHAPVLRYVDAAFFDSLG